MKLKWKPHVYPKLVIDHRYHQYLILNADYASWVFLDPLEFSLFAALQEGSPVKSLTHIYSSSAGVSLQEAKKQVKQFLAKLRLNRILFPSSHFPQRISGDPGPLESVFINVTAACNLHCPYCYMDAGQGWEDELTFSEIQDVIDSSAELGAHRIVFTGGEPLLREEIYQLGHYVKGLGLQSEVITNGTLIHEQNVGLFPKAFDSIAVSLDGSTEEIHESLRGEGTFVLTRKALDLLMGQGMELVVNTVITKMNYLDIPALNHLVSQLGSSLHNTFLHLPFGRGTDDGLSCTPLQIERLRELMLEGMQLYRSYPFVQHRINAAPPQRGLVKNSCGTGQTELIIDSRGDVYPCRLLQMDELWAGNIRENSLQEIYTDSDRLQRCRLVNLEQIPECRACDFSRICAGSCRAMHYAYTGDLFQNKEWICTYLQGELLSNLWMKQGYFPRDGEEVS